MYFQNYICTFKYYSPYAICLYELTVTVTVSSWHLSLVNNCTLSQSHFIAMLCLHGLAVNHFKITFLFEMTSFLLGWLNFPILYCSGETKDTKLFRVLNWNKIRNFVDIRPFWDKSNWSGFYLRVHGELLEACW